MGTITAGAPKKRIFGTLPAGKTNEYNLEANHLKDLQFARWSGLLFFQLHHTLQISVVMSLLYKMVIIIDKEVVVQ